MRDSFIITEYMENNGALHVVRFVVNGAIEEASSHSLREARAIARRIKLAGAE